MSISDFFGSIVPSYTVTVVTRELESQVPSADPKPPEMPSTIAEVEPPFTTWPIDIPIPIYLPIPISQTPPLLQTSCTSEEVSGPSSSRPTVAKITAIPSRTSSTSILPSFIHIAPGDREGPILSLPPLEPLSGDSTSLPYTGATPSQGVNKKRAISSITPYKGNAKSISRLVGLHYTFTNYLPEEKPTKTGLTDLAWEDLRQHKETRTLVDFVGFEDNSIVISMSEPVDSLYHSFANYGFESSKISFDRKTRFRWWSDTQIRQIKPVKNRLAGVRVERQVTLPEEIVQHTYIKHLAGQADTSVLLSEIGKLFKAIIDDFVTPEDRHHLTDGYGITRKRLRSRSKSLEEIFDDKVEYFVQEWNRRL